MTTFYFFITMCEMYFFVFGVLYFFMKLKSFVPIFINLGLSIPTKT